MTADRPDLVGTSVPRREDARLLWGRGRYVADLAGNHCLHVAFVRSTQSRARLLEVNTLAASGEGVHLVLTGADIERELGSIPLLAVPNQDFVRATNLTTNDPRLRCLAIERVNYVGEPIAVVVAESRAEAEDAAELVEIVYEPLPVILGVDDALKDGADPIHRHLPSNEAARIDCSFGDIDAARAAAALTLEGTYAIGRHGALPLECRGAYGSFDRRRGRVELWTSTQIPHLVREGICAVTGWDTDEVRVATPDVGGGFGTKANVYAEEILVAYLARALGRDVVWIEDRAEHMVASAQGRDQVHRATISLDQDGRILAWEDEFFVDVGAGSLWAAGIVANTAIHLMGPYRIPAFRAVGRAAYTNKTIVAQYRGAGRPEACFVLERSLDEAALKLGISPIEVRRRNLLTGSDLPYPRPLPYRDGRPIVYDGGDYLACFEACLKMLTEEDVLRAEADHPGLSIGYGTSTYIEATGRGPYEMARVTLTPSGRFEVAAGSANAGQSQETTLAQIAADALHVGLSDITVVLGDTDATTAGIGTFASRSAVAAGNAVYLAATRLTERASQLTAMCLEANGSEILFEETGFRVELGEGELTWADLAFELGPSGRLARERPLEEVATFEPDTVTWTMGAHASIVGVDRETGLCSVLRYAVAHEGGLDINPLVVEGQIIGGVAQGIGGALLEEFAYSAEGQPLSGTLADYMLPGSCDVPRVDVLSLHIETPANPLGLRGVGESGTIPVYATIASATQQAVGQTSPWICVTPITPVCLVADLPVAPAAASE